MNKKQILISFLIVLIGSHNQLYAKTESHLNRIHFGIGGSISNLGKSENDKYMVEKARINSKNKVKVDISKVDQAGVFLETHIYLNDRFRYSKEKDENEVPLYSENKFYYGPFIGGTINNGEYSKRLLRSFSGGLLVGYSNSEKLKNSLNIGVGVTIEPDAHVLDEEFKIDEIVTDDESNSNSIPKFKQNVKYKIRTIISPMFMLSYGF